MLNILSISAALTLGARLTVFKRNFPTAAEAGASSFYKSLLVRSKVKLLAEAYNDAGNVVAHAVNHANDVLNGLLERSNVGHNGDGAVLSVLAAGDELNYLRVSSKAALQAQLRTGGYVRPLFSASAYLISWGTGTKRQLSAMRSGFTPTAVEM